MKPKAPPPSPFRRTTILRQTSDGYTLHTREALSSAPSYEEEKLLGAIKFHNARFHVHPHGAVGMWKPIDCTTLDEAVTALVNYERH